MEIINLSEEYENIYCKCLEDWSEEMDEAGDLKKRWLEAQKNQGLRVKLARSDTGEIVGMIHYGPIEHAPAIGKELYYAYCIWVHGNKRGVGNHQKKGIGTKLLEAAENDVRELGGKGLAAWGIRRPYFMRSSWFKKHGYTRADKAGMIELVWKPFTDTAEKPQLLKPKKKPGTQRDAVTVTCLRNGWCPVQNLACERIKRAALEFEEKVRFVEIDTNNRKNLDEWGIADAIFIDHAQVVTGPPPTYAKLQKQLAKQVQRLP